MSYRISIAATGETLDEVYEKLNESVERLAPWRQKHSDTLPDRTMILPKAAEMKAPYDIHVPASATTLADVAKEKADKIEAVGNALIAANPMDALSEFERKNLESQAEAKAREAVATTTIEKKTRTRKAKETAETAQVLTFPPPPASSTTPAPLIFAPPQVPASAVQVEVPSFAKTPPPLVFAQPPVAAQQAQPMVQALPSVAPVAAAAPVYADPITIPETQKPAHSFATFKANFNLVVVGLVNTKQIDREYIEKVCNFYKVDIISKVANDDAKCQGFFKVLVEAGLITEMA